MPDTDIWLSDIVPAHHDVELRLGDPVNATRRPGYDNQPAFLYVMDTVGGERGHTSSIQHSARPPVGFLYASADSLGATDIYRWDPYTKASVRVTQTRESEYSPTPFGVDRNSRSPSGFHVVRVEADSTQRLWQFDIDGSNPQVVMSDVDSIGYFAWIDENKLAAFVLGNEEKKQPHTLRIVDVKTQTETIVARNIGRAIHRMPGGKDISFTVQDDDDTFRFMTLHEGDKAPRTLIDATGSGQDAAWLGNGTMLMSAGSAIYAATFPKKGGPAAWRLVRDFADTGIAVITRLTVAPDQDRIAFVATTTAPWPAR